jgi:hypothetical protein
VTTPAKIEARNNKGYYLTRLLITAVPPVAILSIFITKGLPHTDNVAISKGINFAIIPAILVSVILPCYFMYNYLDKKVKLAIDDEGIWSPKTKNIQWANLRYFFTTQHRYRGDVSYCLFIRLKDEISDSQQPMEISLSHLDKNFKDLRNAVQLYASRNNIKDLGHEEK